MWKNHLGFSTSLGADYSTSKLILLSRSFALSYFHTISSSAAVWTIPSHYLGVQPSDTCKLPWLSRKQDFVLVFHLANNDTMQISTGEDSLHTLHQVKYRFAKLETLVLHIFLKVY